MGHLHVFLCSGWLAGGRDMGGVRYWWVGWLGHAFAGCFDFVLSSGGWPAGWCAVLADGVVGTRFRWISSCFVEFEED